MVSSIPFGLYQLEWTDFPETYSSIFCLNPKSDITIYHPSGISEKTGWGVESIMVSDLPVYRRNATSVTVWIQKKGEFV